MSLNVTDDRSEGDRQTSVQMTNGSKSEFSSEFSRDRGGDRRPVGGEQLVQVEEEVECTSSGVEWSGTLVRVSLVHRAHQRILSTSQKTFSSPSDALRIRESRLTKYSKVVLGDGEVHHKLYWPWPPEFSKEEIL